MINKKYVAKLKKEINKLLKENTSYLNSGDFTNYIGNCRRIGGISFALSQYSNSVGGAEDG